MKQLIKIYSNKCQISVFYHAKQNANHFLIDVFIEEFFMEAAHDSVIYKPFLLFGYCSCLILENCVFIPSLTIILKIIVFFIVL